MAQDDGRGRGLAQRVARSAIVVAATIWAGAAAAQSYSFSSVRIEGNQLIEDGTILTYLGIGRGEAVSGGQINAAAQRLRETGLFAEVDVIPQGGTLVVQVAEYPTIARINFEGNARLGDEQLAAAISSIERRVYSPTRAEADAAAITEAYAVQGRINATVRPVIIPRDGNQVDLVFEIFEGAVSEIERVSFVGNRAFSDGRLRGVLETKQAGLLRALIQRDTFDPQRLDFDQQVLTDFYRSRGYADMEVQSVDVQLTRERDAYLITFNVNEGQQYRIGRVDVATEVPEANIADYAAELRPQEGAVYSPDIVDNNVERLERLAVRQGIDFVRVDPRITRNPASGTLDITYTLVRGERIFVERIDIEGNNTTLDRVIRAQFRTVEGDPLNPRAIRESANRIRALGYFADVQVDTRPGSSEDQVVVDVDVEERPTGSLSFGANYNSDNGVSLVASFSERNFLGRGQSLDFRLNAGRRSQVFSFGFGEPNFLGRDLNFGFDLAYRRTDNDSALYDTDSFRIAPSLQFPISERGSLQVFYATEYTDITDVSEEASPLIQAEAAEGGIWTQALGYSYSWDSRRDGLDESTRFLLRFGQEFGVGDVQYIRTTALATAETRVFREDVVLRATIEGGLLDYNDGASRVTDRYFLGSRYLRGFDTRGIGPRDANTLDALGGNKYAVARLEAEFPLGLPEEYGISGGVFVDYGSVWDVGDLRGLDEGDVLYNDFTPRAVVGASLFWTTPLGPLRFNFTEALQSEEFDETRNFDITIATQF
ncbi:outer membrane protein assembly factor BamA [Wenxinia marina]|uniref:Outer membrane protein assembly factor BamA n=1 Tax=Wenxinia marina DSM 24838 TaxID=1123501 RepID=A0A0D0NHE0_9RHOB|nr:outer membrane protein assembly factor BamA [Wenxinia marina]KIQ67720.1 Beta-barrel assembly machine subunit BamA [Wenxinia marina DSM 24838]GGL77707.1 outer membrane protein assembly factor BamA [Wenxinia marina]